MLDKVDNNMLQFYREKSSFNSKNLENFIDTEEAAELKKEVFKRLENDPLFHKSAVTQRLDEVRRISHLRARRIIDYGYVNDPREKTIPLYLQAFCTAIAQYDEAVALKSMVTSHFFGSSVKKLGTLEQQKYSTDAINNVAGGCFALTEVAHGTDVRRMQTTATYDPHAQQFVLHTENFEAAKCWIGNMGQAATHATVLAQLIMPDGQNQGIHAFFTPIRDPNTYLTYPGVIIGDMGEKIGLNGMDNGFCMFNHYRIPKENLLSKFGEVTEDGKYYSPITDARKRFGISLGALIDGRCGVLHISVALLTNAITIAVRYSAIRKQFGPNDDQELAIIEYPLLQWRLFPYLSALFAMKACSRVICIKTFDLKHTFENPTEIPNQEEQEVLIELHALLSSTKPLFTWTTQAAIQQCREACGGHGYLKCSGLGDLRNDGDASCTFEGDNNVLQQQASNWLMRLWQQRDVQKFSSPFHSVEFLYKSRANKMVIRSKEELYEPPVLLETYRWLLCWLIQKTSKTVQTLLNQGEDRFTALNHSQLYGGRSLSLAYAEHYLGQCLWEQACEAERICVEVRSVLTQLCALYLLTGLDKHLPYLHQGGYIDSNQSQMIQGAIVTLCGQLKNEAVSLVDAVAPSDFVLNSVLGHSNGEVYNNLKRALMTSPGNMERPIWWTEMSNKFRSHL